MNWVTDPALRCTCTSCGEMNCVTVESRTTRESRRRRLECQSCGSRFTRHEVSEEFFKEALANRKAVSAFLHCLNLTSDKTAVKQAPKEVKYCENCAYMRADSCSFDFPEFGGSFADECSMYEEKKD